MGRKGEPNSGGTVCHDFAEQASRYELKLKRDPDHLIRGLGVRFSLAFVRLKWRGGRGRDGERAARSREEGLAA